MPSRTTLLTLARALGVSRTTVSNAYSRPQKLSPELRERILATARELGYEGPSAVASSLRTGRTDAVGVLFTDDLGYAFSDPVSTLFLAGVAGEVQGAGYALSVISSPRGSGRSALSKAMLDGLIVYSVDDDAPGLAIARARGFPVVSVDQQPEPGVAAVNISDRDGAAAAVAHLAGLGHTALGAVAVAAGPPHCGFVAAGATSRNYVVRERLAGWLSACLAAGISPPATVSAPVNTREHGRHAARLLIAARTRITGIVCLSDELALGVIAELTSQGIDVPGEVSVVGFDDSPLATLAPPNLSTVRQPVREKGAAAARLLLSRLGGAAPGAPLVLPAELVIRDSTAAPPTITCTRTDPLGKEVMQYRILGRTGVSVSPLSLGTMLFGSATGPQDAATMLDLAVAAGINSVDTANVYGRGASEELLGKLLADRPGLRDRLVLASKVHAPMDDDDPNAAGSSRRHIIDQCNASLRRLGVDYLDLYYLHRPSTQIPIDESLRALDDLVRAGKIRYVGTSSFAAWQLMESLWAAKEHGLNRVVAEQSPYSLADRRVERELLPMARSYGIGITVWSPLAGGLLTGKYHEGRSPDGARLDRNRDSDWDAKHFGPGPDAIVDAVTVLAGEKGCTPAQLSLAWLLSREGVASVVLGARAPGQLRELIGATSVSLSDEDLKQLDGTAAPGRAAVPYYLDDSFADFRPHRHRW